MNVKHGRGNIWRMRHAIQRGFLSVLCATRLNTRIRYARVSCCGRATHAGAIRISAFTGRGVGGVLAPLQHACTTNCRFGPAIALERETTSSIWGLAHTLNAGDAFFALGLGLLAKDAVHGDRVLDVGIVLANAVLLGIEHRNRLIRASARARRNGRYRIAYEGTQALMLALSLRVGAMMAAAPPGLADAFSQAGRLLGVAAQLQGQARGTTSPLAKRYAAKALAIIEGSPLTRTYIAKIQGDYLRACSRALIQVA